MHPARKFFERNLEADCFQCNIVVNDRACGKQVKIAHSGNFLKHIQRKHPKEYMETIGILNINKKNKLMKKSQIKTVKICEETIKEGLIELVTTNARPFALLQDSALKRS
jgi:hypothetical protein